ncbi:GLPGLI family protein [Halosquirtibacter xylanolyticus]|uniref:GLPGLI family protein n=1 Tax=Halosquirtibacter xylanolyticus TaxID=3374599 RepID=UPI003749F3A3|nr:GLPGLI family protein [Prolixibacteraceae bacterium]
MKELLFFLILLFVGNVYSQTVEGGDLNELGFDVIEKEIIDTAKVDIFYTLDFRLDPKKPEKMKHAQTFLQIGKHSRCFKDYNEFLSDSVNDDCAKKSLSAMEGMMKLMSVMKRRKYQKTILFGVEEGQLVKRHDIYPSIYEYRDSIPLFDWIITERDSTILNYKCKMATCHYRGRDYEAWFAEGISMPYGPDVFGGLPGLIMDVHDTQYHYHFQLNGLYPVDHLQLIYATNDEKVIASTRSRTRKIYEHTRKFPAEAMKQAFPDDELTADDIANIKPKPYNPMELE